MEQSEDSAFRPTRRQLVQWLAASLALSAVGCSERPRDRVYSYAQLPDIDDDEQQYFATAVLRRGFAKGVLVGNRLGRPIKIEGNPTHPASLGATDAMMQAEILQLWDPDRSGTAWRRGGNSIARPSTWQAYAGEWNRRSSGAPLHVLTGPFTSPTLAAQLARLLEERAGSRWYVDDSGDEAAARNGSVLAFGRAVRALYRLDEAQLVIAVGGDPFCDAAAGVRHCADWARARGRATASTARPARLVALETTPGLFGTHADERHALSPPRIESVLWQMAALLAIGAASPPAVQPGLNERDAALATRLVAMLQRKRGRAMLWPGPQLSVECHAVVHALNRRVGAHEQLIDLIAAPDMHTATLPAPGSLADLTHASRQGEVEALLLLDCNPVYSAPASLHCAEALLRVPFTVHCGSWRNETALQSTWHLPASHPLECWSDARAFDGTTTLLQPAIAPLRDTRSAHELLALLSEPGEDASGKGHRIVRERWLAQWGREQGEALWQESLRRGVVPDSAPRPLTLPDPSVPAMRPGHEDAGVIWGVFPPAHAIADGEYSNNGWLQELPEPLTHITWDNALRVGPATAAAFGLVSGAMASVRAGDSDAPALEVPVWVEAAHAEGAATLASGYGRHAAGRVGNGVGVDNATLRSAVGQAVPLHIRHIPGTHRFALTQIEGGQHDRQLARIVDGNARTGSAHLQDANSPGASASLYSPPASPGHAWGMAIDLDTCIGCNACTVACQAENNIPVVGPDEVRLGRIMHWIRIDAWQDTQNVAREQALFQPVPCMQCENAPCELVCPVGATLHDSEGLNLQVYNRCVGTRFCSNNCPYKVRRFNFRQYNDVTTETLKLMRNPDVTVRDRGVMEKCTYCVQRLSRARRLEQRTGTPLATDAVQTACQSACPTRAIHFGDLNDPDSDVSRMKRLPRNYAMLDELNTRPRTTYLARIGASTEAEDT